LRIPIHRDGWRFIALFLAIDLLLYMLSPWAALAFAPLTLWCVAFFRDPDRVTPGGAGLIVSPADGKLLPISKAVPPPELGLGSEPRLRLSIFMDVFNVHVNRIPMDGRVIALNNKKGRFINASFDKASEHNERMSIRIRGEQRQATDDLAVVQIAGLVARRIRCDLVPEQPVRRGGNVLALSVSAVDWMFTCARYNRVGKEPAGQSRGDGSCEIPVRGFEACSAKE
jgi:phosphatidylserine decarboxylase